MKNEADSKFIQSIKDFEHALSFESKALKDTFYFSGLAKSFEVCLEYAWKYMKREVERAGLEAASPREAIKLAGRIDLLDDVELWLGFLEDRNRAVHDYNGLPKEDYLKTIKLFAKHIGKLKIK